MAIAPIDFYDTLVSRNLDLFCGVPDSLLKDFCACISDHAPEGRNVVTANEGNAVGIACGYHIATGKAAVVYMQNSGEGNALNPLLSIADTNVCSIPMLLVIGWRGEPGVPDEPQHVKQGEVTCALLETMGAPYEVLDVREWRSQLNCLLDIMESESRPVAIVIRKGLFDAYPYETIETGLTMTREEAIEALLSCFGDEDFIVSTTGKTSREVFEARHRMRCDHANDLLVVGGMGHASSIAYGMTLGTSANVWCIDGDGSFLMHMGSLAVIASNMPSNYRYIINVNGAHESVGGQPNVATSIDIAGILTALGFWEVYEAANPDQVVACIEAMRKNTNCALIIRTRQGSRRDLGRPTISPRGNKEDVMKSVARFSREV